MKRIMTAAVAIPVILWLCMEGGWSFFLFISVISSLSLIELYRLAGAKGSNPIVPLGLVAGLLVLLSFFHLELAKLIARFVGVDGFRFPTQSQLLMIVLVGATAVAALVELFRNKGSALLNISATLFGVMYVSLFFGTFIGLRELFTPVDPSVHSYFMRMSVDADASMLSSYGGYMVISVFAMIWICDTAAFHAGSVMGKHKLFPRVSPNKSWEGAVAGFVFAILSALAAKMLVLNFLSFTDAAVIGGIVGTIGQLGDLVESLLKRDAGVKDSGTLIPGHGGAFDRFDSLLLVSPVVYLYVDFIVF